MTITYINQAIRYVPPSGEQDFTGFAGAIDWIVPRGVYTICVFVCGGGGGGACSGSNAATGGGGGDTAWGNNINVTPGEVLYVQIGAGGGQGVGSGSAGGAGGESFISRDGIRLISAAGGGGGVIGPSGCTSPSGTTSTYGLPSSDYGLGGYSASTASAASERSTGGGGAGGYESTYRGGSAVGTTTYAAGGGAGGAGRSQGGGGGVGPWGQGSSGSAGASGNYNGSGGSGGSPVTSYVTTIGNIGATAWSPHGWVATGGLFGGGGAGGQSENSGTRGGYGARGCVRIIWGADRYYPSTNTGPQYNGIAGSTSAVEFGGAGSQSWTVPDGISSISVCCIGGGGAGNQGTSTLGKGSGAGGGLGWAIFKCIPGETFTVTVGAGGQSTAVNTVTQGSSSSITRNVQFKGFITGTTLHVVEMISGLITTGQTITAAAGVTACGIDAFISGAQTTYKYGGVGAYTVGVSQTVGSLTNLTTFNATEILLTATAGESARGVGGGTPVGGSWSASGRALGSGGGNGGVGGLSSTSSTARGGGGAGAGGYQGTGGNGRNASATVSGGQWPVGDGNPTTSLPGAACGGGTGTTALTAGSGGGGVQVLGIGPEGNLYSGTGSYYATAAQPSITAGLGGSFGSNGSGPASTAAGGNYGGGAGGAGSFSSGRSNGAEGRVGIFYGARMPHPDPGL